MKKINKNRFNQPSCEEWKSIECKSEKMGAGEMLRIRASICLTWVIGPLLILLTTNFAVADTKRVEAKANKADVIDVIASISGETCGSLISTPSIKTQAKNGEIGFRMVPIEVPEGQCKGRTVKVLAVGYVPNRNFKGSDTATITYRAPRRSYYMGQDTMLQTTIYKITVK